MNYQHRVRTVPDSDGMCSYVVRVEWSREFVADITKPGSTCAMPDDAQLFLWADPVAGLAQLAGRHPWILPGATAARSR